MAREIKFRAFFDRPGSEEMFYNVGYHPTILEFHQEKGRGEAGEITVTPLANGYHIMQFTGLLDKNGKEIYEGDILKNPEGKIGSVIFRDGKFCLEIHRSETSSHYIHLSQGFCNNKTIEGNIFEKP